MEKVYGSLVGNNSGTVTTLSKEEIQKLINNLPADTQVICENRLLYSLLTQLERFHITGRFAAVPGYDGNEFGKTISQIKKVVIERTRLFAFCGLGILDYYE